MPGTGSTRIYLLYGVFEVLPEGGGLAPGFLPGYWARCEHTDVVAYQCLSMVHIYKSNFYL